MLLYRTCGVSVIRLREFGLALYLYSSGSMERGAGDEYRGGSAAIPSVGLCNSRIGHDGLGSCLLSLGNPSKMSPILLDLAGCRNYSS